MSSKILALTCGAALSLAAFGSPQPAQTKGKENTAALCSDLVDNDGDGYTDCADAGCDAFCGLVEQNCHDHLDDDFDGLTDCADADCSNSLFCGPENTDSACSDGLDNDGDGDFDCVDVDCQGVENGSCGPEDTDDTCNDRIDNDADGNVDCGDTDCAATAFCSPEALHEASDADCADGRDNDGDLAIDCADTDCQGSGGGYAGCDMTEAGHCDDWLDNDGDGKTDCADIACSDDLACQAGVPEDTVGLCQDGLDNDGDTEVDCADSDCLASFAVDFCGAEQGARCEDGLDNDGDAKVDCGDLDCRSIPACSPVPTEGTQAECSDRSDNDADGKIDCADDGCKTQPFCMNAESGDAACQDGFDNDADTKIDCADADCAAAAPCATPENTVARCGDGQDNDGDMLKDCADPDCAGVGSCENPEVTCSGGFDNDADGLIDCADPDCAADASCTPPATKETLCSDGLDNDTDGFTDCADFDCLLNFAEAACDTPALNVHDLQDATDNDAFAGTRGDNVNDPVRLRNLVVTYVESNTRVFYVADAAGGIYTGVRVYVPASVSYPTPVAAGEVVDVAGLVTERVGETEIYAYGLRHTGSTATLPAPIAISVADTSARLPLDEQGNDRYATNQSGTVTDPWDDEKTAERYEGVLVQLAGLEVMAIDRDALGAVDAYELAKAPAHAWDDRLHVSVRLFAPTPELAVGQPVAKVAGLVSYVRHKIGGAFIGAYRVEPRDAADWQYAAFVDSDGDGLEDSVELTLGTSPNDLDSDHDWLDDGYEVGDPSAPWDSDSDGAIDALEAFLLDKDGDGVPDDLDAQNRDKPNDDRDGDGVANTDDADDDGDGIADATDLCPFAPVSQAAWWYPDEPNTDANAAEGDLYDLSHSGDSCDFDRDGDWWPNPYDNCPDLYNADQIDSDGDGFGDACQPTTILAPSACSDPLYGGSGFCEIIFEEVFANVSASSTLPFDANRDGIADSSKDEFVELRNVSAWDLDLSGLTLDDGASFAGTMPTRHIFPANTILRQGERLVVFGGGTPQFFPSSVVVQTASSGKLELNNDSTGGDTVYLRSGTTILAQLSFGSASTPHALRNVALTRYPDGTVNYDALGNVDPLATWVAHPLFVDSVTGTRQYMSPGSAPDYDK